MTVEQQIAKGDQWYVADQAATQMSTPGARAVIENRWRQFDRMIRSWSGGKPGRSIVVLDAGCGDGNNVPALKGIFERIGIGATIIGIDYNELRLSRCRSRTEAAVLKADLLALPFGPGAVDLVLCNHVIEHIADDFGMLRELRRILKRDGLLILGTPNEGCLLAKLRNHVLQRKNLRMTDHVHFYTAKSLMERVRRAGLAPREAIQREGFFVPHFGVVRILREIRLGRGAMDVLARLFPSQCAGLLLAAAAVDAPASDRQ